MEAEEAARREQERLRLLEVFLLELFERFFAFEKTKMQISCAVTAQLISAFVFFFTDSTISFFLSPKFQAFNLIL